MDQDRAHSDPAAKEVLNSNGYAIDRLFGWPRPSGNSCRLLPQPWFCPGTFISGLGRFCVLHPLTPSGGCPLPPPARHCRAEGREEKGRALGGLLCLFKVSGTLGWGQRERAKGKGKERSEEKHKGEPCICQGFRVCVDCSVYWCVDAGVCLWASRSVSVDCSGHVCVLVCGYGSVFVGIRGCERRLLWVCLCIGVWQHPYWDL